MGVGFGQAHSLRVGITFTCPAFNGWWGRPDLTESHLFLVTCERRCTWALFFPFGSVAEEANAERRPEFEHGRFFGFFGGKPSFWF